MRTHAAGSFAGIAQKVTCKHNIKKRDYVENNDDDEDADEEKWKQRFMDELIYFARGKFFFSVFSTIYPQK